MMEYGDFECIGFSNGGGILTVTLKPPTPLNAVNGVLHRELASLFATIAADGSVDVVLLTGHGLAFCAGADITWLRDLGAHERDEVFCESRRIIIDLLELPQPIIAAIEGPAVGLGATVALFCDVKIAAADARIGDPHVLIGVVAGDGGAVIWPWLVGAGRAKYYLMTGELVDAAMAHTLGLVDIVANTGEAVATARALATRLAKGNQAAIRGTKWSVNKLLRDATNLVLDTSLALEKETMASEAHRQALDRFLAKQTDQHRQARGESVPELRASRVR
jgi:enoyl-CoA hydratase